MYKILCFLLIKLALNMMVFPFKQVYEGKNKGITMDDEKYNGTNYAIDFFNSQLFIEMNLGNPIQTVKVLLSGESCAFKIGKSKYCIYEDKYLSYYNRNNSGDFNFTPKYNAKDIDFNNELGHTAEDSLEAFTDLELKNKTNFKKIGFFLGSDTTDKLCGIIGLEKDNFICNRTYNIVKDSKSRKFINNYNFMLKYNNSFDNGQYIIGGELKDIMQDYNESKVFKIVLTNRVYIYKFGVIINKAVLGEITSDTNNTLIDVDIPGEINNDRTFIVAGKQYFKNFSAQFFEKHFASGACGVRIYDNNPELMLSEKYKVIECDKKKFGKDELNDFPKFYLYLGDYYEERKIFFDSNDLFTEGKYKYFFNIVFDNNTRNKLELGKVFLKKYPVNFNFDKNMIEIYDNYVEESSTDDPATDGGNPPTPKKEFPPWALGLIIALLVIIVGVLGYFLGKYFNKIRKKRANELTDDDYEYKTDTPKENQIEEGTEGEGVTGEGESAGAKEPINT